MRRWCSFHSDIDLFEQKHHQERLDMLTFFRKRKKARIPLHPKRVPTITTTMYSHKHNKTQSSQQRRNHSSPTSPRHRPIINTNRHIPRQIPQTIKRMKHQRPSQRKLGQHLNRNRPCAKRCSESRRRHIQTEVGRG